MLNKVLDTAGDFVRRYGWAIDLFILLTCLMQLGAAAFTHAQLTWYHVSFGLMAGLSFERLVLGRPTENILRDHISILQRSYKALWEQYNVLTNNYVNSTKRDKPS